jgi:ABC-type transport system involved in multi-copper enzyme maturation permease subunit
MQIFRRRATWVLLFLGTGNFIKAAVIVYVMAQVQLPPTWQGAIMQRTGFSPHPQQGQEAGYTRFMNQQSLVTMLVLAFSGRLLIGADFQNQAMPFYLSRRIDRRHYIAGKLAAISTLVALVTVVPTVVLFLEFGLFTGSLDYWQQHWTMLVAIVGYGAVLCAVLSTLLAAISAWLERTGPIVVAWASLFLFMNRMADLLAGEADDGRWRILDPWYSMHTVASVCFGRYNDPQQQELFPWAAAALTLLCATALAALFVRVRAVDVVR